MRYTQLGKSGVRISRLCLGTMNFGGATAEGDAFALLDKAVEYGINFIDTADIYDGSSSPTGTGLSEQIIGRWFALGGGRREFVVLGTKVFGALAPPVRPDPNLNRGLSARKIIQGCDGSLNRLKTDRIDLYQMHHIDRHCPIDEWMSAMETLQRQGKICYIGSSNFAGWDIATACMTADVRPGPRLVSEQSVYNLTNRMVELEVFPACRHFGLGLIAWSPLAQGLLGGALARRARGERSRLHVEQMASVRHAQIESYEQFCRELGAEPAIVALAWVLANPVISAPVIGARNEAQLADAASAVEFHLSTEALKQLDLIFPGPSGEAPDAYI